MRTRDGDKPGISTFKTQRTGLFHLYRMYGLTMDANLYKEIGIHYAGLRRRTAISISEGVGAIKIGKDPLDFGLYRFIALKHLQSISKQYIFSHTFLLLCWNLMCRAGSCVKICFSHLEWREDSLCV